MPFKNKKIIALVLVLVIIISDSSEVLAKTRLPDGISNIASGLFSNFNMESIIKVNLTNEEDKTINKITEKFNEDINRNPELLINNTEIQQVNIKYVKNIDYNTNIVTWDGVLGLEYDVEVDGTIIDVKENMGYFHRDISENSEHVYRVRAKRDGVVGPWSNEFIKNISKDKNYSNAELERMASIKNTVSTQSQSSVKFSVHRIGYDWSVPAENIVIGNVGDTIDGIKIQLNSLPSGVRVKYRVYVAGTGWQQWVYDNQIAGVLGKQIQGIEVKLVDVSGGNIEKNPEGFNIEYNLFCDDLSNANNISKDGEMSGVIGKKASAFLVRIINAKEFIKTVISENTTWTLSGSPYIVQGELIINQGVKLNIDPGVKVIFKKYASRVNGIKVNGTLAANGSLASPIIFTYSEDGTLITQDNYMFKGIEVTPTGEFIGNYCNIEQKGIFSYHITNKGKLKLNNSKINTINDRSTKYSHGILLEEQIDTSIQNSTITNCNIGVLARDSLGEVTVSNNKINNNKFGMEFLNNSIGSAEQIIFKSNELKDNEIGINIVNKQSRISKLSIDSNNIINSKQVGIQFNEGDSSNVIIYKNTISSTNTIRYDYDKENLMSGPICLNLEKIKFSSNEFLSSLNSDDNNLKNNLNGNNYDGIVIKGKLNNNLYIPSGKNHYIIDHFIDIPKGIVLDIQAGAIINIRGAIWSYGKINSEGTSTRPIIFTSITDKEFGITHTSAKDYDNSRDINFEAIYVFAEGEFNGINTKIRFGGRNYSQTINNDPSNLKAWGKATLINSEVGESLTNGIVHSGSLKVINTKIYNCVNTGIGSSGELSLINSTITKNRFGVFRYENYLPLSIISNSFTGNTTAALAGSDTIINAEYNFWGSPYGPSYYDANKRPIINGDMVYSNIDFEPYLASEYKISLGNEFNEYINDLEYKNKKHFGQEGVNSATGNFSRNYTDLTSNFDGYEISISRIYNSMDLKDSVLGKGWRFGFQGDISDYTNESGVKSKIITLPNGSTQSFKENSDGTYTANDSRNILNKQADNTIILTTKDQDKYCYNSAGKLVWIKDRNDNMISINIDSNGKISQVTDATGRKFTINYNNNFIDNIVETFNGNTGRIIKYTYQNGFLSSVTDGVGNINYYEYDTKGLLCKIKDKSNNVLETINYVSDGEDKGKVKDHKDIYGNINTYSYDNMNKRTIITDSNKKVTEEWYDNEKYITFTIYPDITVSFSEYFLDDGINKYGEIKSETNRNRATYVYERDAKGNRTKIINPDLSHKAYVYDEKNNLIKESDENGKSTYYVYDSKKNNLIKKAQPLDGISEYKEGVDESKFTITLYNYYSESETISLGYKVKSLLKSTIDPEGYIITNTYYDNGNIKTIKNQEGKLTTFEYDSLGFKKSEISPKGYKTQYVYDKNGNIEKIILHGNETYRTSYDSSGKKLKEVDAKLYDSTLDDLTNHVYNGDHGTRYKYLANGKIESIKDAADNFTTFKYDLYGNLEKETKPNGAIYSYEYDDMSRIIKTYFQENNSTEKILLEENEYVILSDKFTQKINKKYLNNNEVAISYFTYDYAERLTEQKNPDNSLLLIKYNPNGTKFTETDEENSVSYYYYDGLNRLTNKWIPFEYMDGTTKYTYTEIKYDKNGNKTIEKTGRFAVEKDTLPDSYIIANNSYYKDGNLKYTIDREGRKIEYFYDDDGYLLEEDKYIDSESKIITKYINNYFGKPTSKTEHVKASDIYGYNYSDNTEKLIVTKFTYDKNSNLETVSTPILNISGEQYKSIVTTYGYDKLNRKVSESKPGTDENGNSIIIKNTISYNWEGKEQVLIDSLNNKTEYIYNKRGLIEKVIDAKGGVTAYYYDKAGRKTVEVSPKNYEASKKLSEMERTEYIYDSMDRVKLKINKFYEKKVNSTTYEWTSDWAEVVTKAYKYDESGNVIKELDALGYESGSGTSPDEKINNGYGIEYIYNLNKNLTSKLDPVSKEKGLQFSTKYQYDALGRKYSETNSKNIVTLFELDDVGNTIAIKVKETPTSQAKVIEIKEFDFLNRVKAQTDGNGNITTFIYNNFDKLRKVVYPGDGTINSNTITYQYDFLGQLRKEENIEGVIRLYSYDSQGNLLSEKAYKNNDEASTTITTSTRYDKVGNKRFEYDGNGNVKENSYDELNRLKTTKAEVTNIDGSQIVQTTTYDYDKNSNNISITDWVGNIYFNVYDGINRVIEKNDPYAIIEKIEYNRNNSQIYSYDALNNKTKYSYDKNNRLLITTDPEGHKFSQTYDNVGNIASKTDGRGSSATNDGKNHTTRFEYNEFNKLNKVINAKGEITEYIYDLNGNIISQKDGKGNITISEYNVANKISKKIDPNGRSGSKDKYTYKSEKVESYNYFSDGNLKEKIDRNGKTTRYEYNILNKPVLETVGDISISYTYDNNGNMLTINDDTGITKREYDGLNRVIKKMVPNIGETKFVYDLTTSRVEMPDASYGESSIDPKGNIVTKFFDKTGRVKYILDGDITSNIITTYDYYSNGSTKSVSYKSGVKEEYAYFKNNLLKTLDNKNPDGTLIESYKYEYDEGNNQTKKIDKKGSTIYTYDELNRINSVTDNSGIKIAYSYDKAGNREKQSLTKSGNDISTTTYNYNDQNRLISNTTSSGGIDETTPYTYDNNGNLLYKGKETLEIDSSNSTERFFASIAGENENEISKDITFYEYDDLNRLIKAEVGGKTSLYKYNGEGLRVEKTVDGVTTKYLYEGMKIVLELDALGEQKAKNIYGTNLVTRKVGESNQNYFYLYNGHGDVTALADESSQIIATYYYDAFGVPIEVTGNIDNYIRYAGYQYDDETGNYYLMSRMYDPNIARFLQEDTYRGEINDPLSLNLYTYCHNNPITYDDPNGHWVHIAIGAVIGAVVNTAFTAYNDYKDDRKFNSGWKSYAGSAVEGAVVGGVGAATFGFASAGASFYAVAAVNITAAYAGSVARQYISSGEISHKQAAYDSVINEVGSLLGGGITKGIGKVGKSVLNSTVVQKVKGVEIVKLSSAEYKSVSNKVENSVKEIVDNFKISNISKELKNNINLSNSGINSTKIVGNVAKNDPLIMDLQLFGNKGVRNPEIVLPSKPHTNGTQGHWETILDEVDVMKNSGDYKKVYVNKGLSNEIPGAKPNRRPDVMGVRHDGIIDQVEVPSKTDDPAALLERMIDNKKIIGDRAGTIKVRPIK